MASLGNGRKILIHVLRTPPVQGGFTVAPKPSTAFGRVGEQQPVSITSPSSSIMAFAKKLFQINPSRFVLMLKPTNSIFLRQACRAMSTGDPREPHFLPVMVESNTQLDISSDESCECPHDVLLALEDHLCRKWGLSRPDSSTAVKYAPRFVRKLKVLVDSTGNHKEMTNVSDQLKNEVGSLKKKYRIAVETLLNEDDAVNGVDLFLESIGKEECGSEPHGIEIELCTDRGVVAATRLLERYGFPRSNVYGLIQQHNFLFNCYDCELEKTLKTLETYGFNAETLPSLLQSCPSILDSGYLNQWHPLFCMLAKYPNRAAIIEKVLKYSRKFGLEPVGPLNYKENIKFLSKHGIGSFYIGRCLEKCPLLFYLNRHADLEPKIQVLRDGGVRKETVCHVLRKYLNFVTYRAPSLALKIEYLRSIGLAGEDIDQVFSKFPAILAHSVEDKLKPIVTELQSLGFGGRHLVKAIVEDPYVFSMKVGGELSRCVSLLKNLKCRKPIQEKILRQSIIKGSRRVKARVEFLNKHGISHREAFKLLEKEPRIVLYDFHSIEQKVNFLINDMRFPVRTLIEVPDYLGVNFDKQIVPRYRVIAYLRSRGGLGVDVTLKDLMRLTRIQFYNKYVRPYPDTENIFRTCIKEEENLGSKEKQT